MDENEFNELLKIQRMMASKIIQESTVDNKIKLLNLINRLVSDRNKKVQKAIVIYEAQSEGFSDEETEEIIDELIRDDMILEPEQGYLKRA